MARKLEVEIVGDARSLHRALGQAGSSSGKLGSALGKGLKVAALGAGAALGGLAIAAKIGFDEFSENQKVMAQTNAVLKSTGKAANVTAKHVDELARSISEYSGLDDEAVQAGENILLTFTGIRNEVGKGNDVFDQATKVTADFAVALGKDMPDAAMAIGKALNNPIKGMGRLEKVGVSFTDKQKNLIKSLTESGDTIGAQKVILKELNKEFGGSAKAFGQTMPGQIARFKESFKNGLGQAMAALAPFIEQMLDFANKHMPEIQAAFKTGMGVVSSAIGAVAGFIQRNWGTINDVFQRTVEWIKTYLLPIIGQLKDIWVEAVTRIGAVLKEHGPELRRIWGRVGEALKIIAKVVVPILKVALTEILPRAVGMTITVLDKVTGVIEKVARVTRWVIDKIKAAWNEVKPLIDKVRGWFDLVRDKAASAFGAVRDSVQWVIDKVETLIGWVQTAIDWINKIPAIPDVPGFGGGGGHKPSKSEFGGPGKPGLNPRMVGATGGGTYIAQVFLDGAQIAEAAFQPMRNQAAQFRRVNGQAAF